MGKDKNKTKLEAVVAPATATAVDTVNPAPEAAAPAKTGRGVQRHEYPMGAEVLVLVDTNPKGLGRDQMLRATEMRAAAKQAEAEGKPFTAEYAAANCPGQRRTLRRACRAGLVKGYGPAKTSE